MKIIISLNDPRFLSGELVHIATGKVTVKDKNGKMLQVDLNDPRFLSGELVHNTKGKIVVKDKDGKTLQVDQNDHRFLSGELVGINKGLVIVKDINGHKFKIHKSDNRYNISLFPHSATLLIIDEIIYTPQTASAKYNVSRHIVLNRCKSRDYINWSFV